MQYFVSFELNQRGDYTGWIKDVLRSGIREGESLDNVRIIDAKQFNSDLSMLLEVKSTLDDFIDLFVYNNDVELQVNDKKLLNDFIFYINNLKGL